MPANQAVGPGVSLSHFNACDQPPPIEFQRLVDSVVPNEIKPAIAELPVVKANTRELGYGPPMPEINAFIAAELERQTYPANRRDSADTLVSKLRV